MTIRDQLCGRTRSTEERQAVVAATIRAEPHDLRWVRLRPRLAKRWHRPVPLDRTRFIGVQPSGSVLGQRKPRIGCSSIAFDLGFRAYAHGSATRAHL